MGDIYILMLVALTILAIIDLVVGVSNDAVNFLNSAIIRIFQMSFINRYYC